MKPVPRVVYNRTLPITESCDICVIGGSQSGVAAAIAAKRANPETEVFLLEQYGYLGGQSIGTMVCHYEFREYTNNAGQIIAQGLGKEMIARVVQKGHSDPLYQLWLDKKGPPFQNVVDGRAMGDIPLDLEDLKLTLQEMCDEAGVLVHLNTKFIDVITEVNFSQFHQIQQIIVADLNGLHAISTKIVIDCSANNDVAWAIGHGDAVSIPPESVMPMQTYAWFGGVDCEKFINAFWEHRERWQMVYPDNKAQMLDHMRSGKTMMMRGGADYLDEAEEKYPGIMAELEKYAHNIIYYWLKPVKIIPITVGTEIHYDSWWAIEGPVSSDSQVSPRAVSDFAQKQLIGVHVMQKIHSVLPGWEKCYVIRTADRVGFRQTRVLKGIYQLTEHDIRQNAQFADVIGRSAAHDISRGKPQLEFGYDIPYRAIVPETIDGLLVGARSPSVKIEPGLVALNAHRGISATIIISQAAGVAAALCIQNNVQPRHINIQELQHALRNQDVVLDRPTST